METGLDRSSLRFAEVVRAEFAFLESEYALRSAERTPTLVRYESPDVTVVVYHGRSSYEVDVEITPGDARYGGEPPFTLADLAALCDRQELLPAGFLQASTSDAVRSVVARAAELVRECGDRVLRTDPFELRRLTVLRSERAQREGLERKLSAVRAAAASAWRERDYRRVEELYRSIEPHLTPAERKKLDYAYTHESPHRPLRP
jgi:hypothetical protein